MKTLRPTPPSGRASRRITVGISTLSIGALLALGAVTPAVAVTGDPAESSTQFVTASGLNLSLADLAGSYASAPSGPASSSTAFDAAVYGALTDEIALLGGNLARVPLVYDASVPQGLLSVAQSDIVGFSSTPSAMLSSAANGAVDPVTGAFTELSTGGSTVNLASAFDALGVSPATREILSQIDLQVGTAASQANAGSYTAASGDYRLDGLSLQLTSPLLQQLPTLINAALEEATVLAEAALEAVAPGGIIPLPAGTIPDIPVGIGTLQLGDVTLQVTAPNFDNVVSDVMNAPGGVVVVSDDGIATVNLNTGEIFIDLALLYGGGVNGLGANTEVFTSPNMAAISNAVANALSKTTGLFANGVVNALHATQLGMSVDVSFIAAPNSATPNLNNLVVATGTLTGSGSLDDFANGTSVFTSTLAQAPGLPSCARPTSPPFNICLAPTSVIVGGAILAINTAVPTIIPPAIAVVAGPLMAALQDAEAVVIAEVEAVVADVYQSITSAFDWLMPTLARVVVNEQPAIGDLGAGSFTVRALGVTLLPTFPFSSHAHIGLASSTVLAFADPSVDITQTEVRAGDALTITGAGWNPAGSQVTLSFVDAANAPVGAPFFATPAPDGTITTSWTVPTGTADGVLTLTASQDGLERTDTVNVHTPVVPPTPVDPKLPSTGSEPVLPLGLAGLGLLAVGGALLATRLRRS
ncbi:MAG: choice-of-anchor G family protein [Leucobacter sp.]